MITKFVKKQKISLYHIKFKSVKNPSEIQIQYSKICTLWLMNSNDIGAFVKGHFLFPFPQIECANGPWVHIIVLFYSLDII